MSQLDALKLRSVIQERLVELALDESFVRDVDLSRNCRAVWSADPPIKGGLVSDLWVEAAFPATVPATSPRTLQDLVDLGLFDKALARHLDSPDVFPADRVLYAHQVASVKECRATGEKRPAIVVTAGTGAGKTECFLLPMLNQLYSQPRRTSSGVRCIVLYPMNALVNDQVDRMYRWLHGQERVTLFHFTSETPEDKDAFFRRHKELWHRCRFNTRRQARGREKVEGKRLAKIDIENGQPCGPVPDILITNYSMLEYMLCRPQDAVFFGPALEAVILDEAHLYSGTLAAEITLLLRRVSDRCGVSTDDVLHVATSATLGKNTLKSFIGTIFSKDPSLVREPIEGELRRDEFPVDESASLPTLEDFANRSWLTADTLQLDDSGSTQFTAEEDGARWSLLCDDLRLLASDTIISRACDESARAPARLLYEVLRTTPLVQRLANVLHDCPRMSLPSLAARLWGSDSPMGRDATIKLLRMAAAARLHEGDYPLVPHRLHLLMRAPEGICVCLNPQCTSEGGKLYGLGRIIAGYETSCPSCSSATLSLYRCGNCGELAIAGHEREFKLHAVRPTSFDRQDNGFGVGRRVTLLVLKSYGIRFNNDFDRPEMHLRASDGAQCGVRQCDVTLFDISKHAMCPNCGEQRRGQTHPFVPFMCSTSLALSVLAETILAELPEYGSDHRQYLPARGRRLLAFTDAVKARRALARG